MDWIVLSILVAEIAEGTLPVFSKPGLMRNLALRHCVHRIAAIPTALIAHTGVVATTFVTVCHAVRHGTVVEMIDWVQRENICLTKFLRLSARDRLTSRPVDHVPDVHPA